jgi:hypothetical protein
MTTATEAKWRITGEWATAANITGAAWRSVEGFSFDEVNEEGLVYRYSMIVIAADGVHASEVRAKACYGLVNAFYANHSVDEWNDQVLAGLRAAARHGITGEVDLCVKHQLLDCDEMMHAAQVLLENEDEDNCDACDKAATI